MGFVSIKKKTRGLRSKVKRIDSWKEENIILNLDMLKNYGREYVKIWIPPFYNLYTINKYEVGHKNPPKWFNRIILEAMIEIYESWEKTLNELNEPYYLKIWLYEQNFINSQIVAAIGDSIEYYENLFEKSPKVINFPIEKYQLADKNIMKFNWELYKDQIFIVESDHRDNLGYLNYMKRKSYKVKKEIIAGKVDTIYYIQQGNIWVGDLKK